MPGSFSNVAGTKIGENNTVKRVFNRLLVTSSAPLLQSEVDEKQAFLTDVVLREIYEREYSPTGEPVSIVKRDGADVTLSFESALAYMQVQRQPPKITLEGVVSDLDPSLLGSFNSIAAEADRLGRNVLELLSGEDNESKASRSYTAFQNLISMGDSMDPVTVTAGLATFEQMIITKIRVERNKDTSNALEYSITLQEMFGIQVAQFSLSNATGVSRIRTERPKRIGKIIKQPFDEVA